MEGVEPPAPPRENAAVGAKVLQLLGEGHFLQLVEACEDAELSVLTSLSTGNDTAPSPEQVEEAGLLYAVHLLAYLLQGQWDAARFLWKRMPTSVQSQPTAAAAHEALIAIWRRRYPDFFTRLASTSEPRLQPLAAEVVSRSRADLLNKIGNAYKVIALSRIAALLGLDESSAREACNARGWAHDSSGNVSPVEVKSNEDLIEMGEAQLRKLAEYTLHLDRRPRRI